MDTDRTLFGSLVGLGVAYYMFQQRQAEGLDRKLQRLREEFRLSSEAQQQLLASFEEQMQTRIDGNQGCLKMLQSFVFDLPTGDETGLIYALDMGGSNYRVVRVSLPGNGGKPDVVYSKDTVPTELMAPSATAEELFDWMALKIVEFAKEHGDMGRSLPIGFTFSFGIEQKALNSGFLCEWTKGYSTQGVVGEDAGKLMQEACNRAGLKAQILAVVNDTVGTLLSCAYENQDCRIGVILGTGSNGCYTEPQYNNEIVNIEWGGFDQVDFRTEVDVAVDLASPNPDRQKLEKMISGFYLGKIAARLFCRFFEGEKLGRFAEAGGFESADVSFCLEATDAQIAEFASSVPRWTADHCRVLWEICRLVRERSATLSATLLSVVVRKTQFLENDSETISVGIDGSLFKLMPRYKEIMESTLADILGPMAQKVRLLQSDDGSGKGAALVVAPLLKC